MSPVLMTIVTPTVIAALVSAIAMICRDLLGRRGENAKVRIERRRVDGEFAIRSQEMLVRQVEALWRENAQSKAREAECRYLCRELEKQCARLEKRCGELEAELARLRRRLAANSVVSGKIDSSSPTAGEAADTLGLS